MLFLYKLSTCFKCNQLSPAGFGPLTSNFQSDDLYTGQQGAGYVSLGAKLADLAAARAGLTANQVSSSSSFSGSTGPSGFGEIYTDVRMESDKKNLLTLPTDPNRMYIKPARGAPAAEVIVYPMGQLLGHHHQYPGQMMGQQETMAMAGSSEIEIEQDGRVVMRGDQQQLAAAAAAPTGGKSSKLAGGGGGGGEEPPPHGLLQTLVRSAKDDLKIVGNVFKHLTGGS